MEGLRLKIVFKVTWHFDAKPDRVSPVFMVYELQASSDLPAITKAKLLTCQTRCTAAFGVRWSSR